MKKIFLFFIFSFAAVTVFGNVLFAQNACPDYVKTDLTPGLRSAEGVLDINQGTASVWAYLEKDVSRRDHLIFATDDSRIVLYYNTWNTGTPLREMADFGARAGVSSNKHEACLIIDNAGDLPEYNDEIHGKAPFPEGEWHFLAMTWKGYPKGAVKLYFDGQYKSQAHYEDGSMEEVPPPYLRDGSEPSVRKPPPLFKTFSVGIRPRSFDGDMKYVPATDMALTTGGIKIKDLRFYKCALPDEEIRSIFQQGSLEQVNPSKEEKFLSK